MQGVGSMLICVNVVQVCDARDDDSSTTAGKEILYSDWGA